MSQQVGNFNSFLFLLDLVNHPTHCPVFESSWEALAEGTKDLVSAAGITTPDEDKFTGTLESHGYCQENSCNFHGECIQSSPYTYNCKCDESHKGERCQIQMNKEFKVRKISGSNLNSRYACEYVQITQGTVGTITISDKDLNHPHCWVLYGPFDQAFRYYTTIDAVGEKGDTVCDNRNAVFHTFHGALSHIDTCELASLRLRAKHQACLAELPATGWVDHDWDTITVLYNPTQESIALESASVSYSIEENKCESGNHDCHSSATCSPISNAAAAGGDSWTCECDKGHTGDGKNSCTSDTIIAMKNDLSAKIQALKTRVTNLQTKYQGKDHVLDASDQVTINKLSEATAPFEGADNAFAAKIVSQLGDYTSDPRTGPHYSADAGFDGRLSTANTNLGAYAANLNTQISDRQDEFEARRTAITAYQDEMEEDIEERYTALATHISTLENVDVTNWNVWVAQRVEIATATETLRTKSETWDNDTIAKTAEFSEIDEWVANQTIWNEQFQNDSVTGAADGIAEWGTDIVNIIDGWRRTKDVFKGTLSDIEYCCSNPIKFDIDINTGNSYGEDGYYRAPFPGYYYVSFNLYADDSAIIGVDLLKNAQMVKGDMFLMDWQRAGVDLLSQSSVLHLEKGDEVNLWLNNANLHNEPTQSGTRKTGQSTFTIFLIHPDYTYELDLSEDEST